MNKLTNKTYQAYANQSESISVDILYNNTFNYFYFMIFKDDKLVVGDSKIVNNYENKYLKFTAPCEVDFATFHTVEFFTLEFLL